MVTSAGTEPERAAAKRHAVIVVHGQGNQRSGEFFAGVVNPIAEQLEVAGARVVRTPGEGAGELTLTVTPPDSGVAEQFHFTEAFWAEAFPAPPPEVVARWLVRSGARELREITRGWWRDPSNNRRDDGEQSEFPANRFVSVVFFVELAFISAALWIVYVLSVPLGLALFALYSLANAPVLSWLGLARPVSRALHALDPFLGATLGDTWRFIEDGAWSVRVRQAVEAPVIAAYRDPDIADVTIIAHSEGCAVAYDALLRDRPLAQAAAEVGPKLLTFVTLGSGLNRNFGLSQRSRRGPFARRLATDPIDGRVSGVAAGGKRAETADEKRALRARFMWLDIHARFDYVPGGTVLRELFAVTGIDRCQLKSRRVINEDDLVDDHGAYFTNTDLVVPRLIRAIYGGEYPWTGDSRTAAPSVTEDRVRQRTKLVACLQAVRLALAFTVVALIGLLVFNDGAHEGADGLFDAVLTLGQADVPSQISLPLAIIAILASAPAIYRFIKAWWFEPL